MASQDGSFSFEALIHADRQRRQNEDLANEIFGRTKAKSNAQQQKKQQQQQPQKERISSLASLASRLGIQKRSSSSNTPTQKNSFNPPSRPSSTTPSHRNNQASARASRIATEIDSGTSTNISVAPPRNKSFTNDRNGGSSTGLTIKGSAGPFALLLSNFAPGTTEADIEAALHTDLFDEAGNNCLHSTQIVSSRPTVVAEMVFTEKSVADRIVSKFNNLKADGRILKVTLSRSGPDTSNASRRSAGDRERNDHDVAQTIEPVHAASDTITGVAAADVEGDMDMEDAGAAGDYSVPTSYDHDREAADRDRLNRDRDRDRDGFGSVQRDDGDDRRDMDRPRDDRERRRDDRDRDRDGDRDRDREREREPDRDRDRDRDRERDRRDYDRRESYSNRQQQPPQQQQQQRPPPPPLAYGNGFNGPFQRGGYGGYGGRGGYGYGRGGYAPRGGYRGGYGR